MYKVSSTPDVPYLVIHSHHIRIYLAILLASFQYVSVYNAPYV